MSFGFSIGDFIRAIEITRKIRRDFVDAPDQFKNVSEDLRSLSIALDDVDAILAEDLLTDRQKTQLRSIDEGCHSVLLKLERTVDEYRELDPRSCGKRAKIVWKRLKWKPEDIQELRSRINISVSLLAAFYTQLCQGNTAKLVQRSENQHTRTVLDWITPTDYGAQQSDFLSRRQKGSGEWVLNSVEFNQWLAENGKTLFCPGIPGSGKTIITSVVVDHLLAMFGPDPDVGIGFLYCNFRRQHEQKPEDLLLGLLKQFAQRQSSLPEAIEDLYASHKRNGSRPLTEQILKTLQYVMRAYQKVFIVIDALDECSGRKELLDIIFKFQSEFGANIFATSRHIADIDEDFKESLNLEIRASVEDVYRYLDGKMPRLPACVSRSSALQETIKTEIVGAVDGMFLLAQLYLDALMDKLTPKAIRQALKTLPKGSDALYSAYNEAMERINNQKSGFCTLAKQVLSWITCARRPLLTSELQHALAVEVGVPDLDEENLLAIEDMISVCAGLVTVDTQSDVIRLVHYTTQEYFEQTKGIWFPDAQTEIAKVCVSYMSLNAFEVGHCRTKETLYNRLKAYPLYNYAACNCGHHASATSLQAEPLVLEFFWNKFKVSAAAQVFLSENGYWRFIFPTPKFFSRVTGLHLAAYFGLGETVGVLLEGADIDSMNGDGTPLSAAASEGHDRLVSLLLKNGANKDAPDTFKQTPLSRAAMNGHEAVVKLLLDAGAEKNSKNCADRTPLSLAIDEGQERVAKLLIEKGARLDIKGKLMETPLMKAADQGNATLIKLLLENGAETEVRDPDWITPLSQAALKGHEAVVDLLLRHGADLESQDKEGSTPLIWAVRRGHKAVVELLLKCGANPEAEDKGENTPMIFATVQGNRNLVKLLLDNGARPFPWVGNSF